ncbi:MAG: cell wall hydrolase [Bacillota bacterium]|nr:cell wall hydrolase [Bacillota bacterium]MDP4169299.1 cell wall hydrolase [Bacillota bacterium]
MKKTKKLVIATVMLLSLSLGTFVLQTDAATRTYKVSSGDTYWKIAVKYGVSARDLIKMNKKVGKIIHPRQKLLLPNSTISKADKELIARLVHAEAESESYAGKVAVATVILNRVASPKFPNTVKGVIYQKSNGHYAFTPVQNKTINKRADASSRKAVNEALAFRGQGKGSLFFFNPKTSSSNWIFSRKTTVKIGNHNFAK